MCVGDIHGEWDAGDERALASLAPDLALFVGDFGDENTQVTSAIGALAARSSFGVATVFGNHDACFTAHTWGRSRVPSFGSRVSLQRAQLADVDASYRSRPFDAIDVSVVGGRPFSWGGPHWKHSAFYRQYTGVRDMKQSSARICSAVSEVAVGHAVVFLGHVGPTGLGELADSPCGRDWGDVSGGDWGDADLRAAIQYARAQGKPVPLVVFGHMHRALWGGVGSRVMLSKEADTVMLNCAVVPRHKSWSGAGKLHNFHVVALRRGLVHRVTEVWISSGGERVREYLLYDDAAATTALSQ